MSDGNDHARAGSIPGRGRFGALWRLGKRWARELARLMVIVGLCTAISERGPDAARGDRALECAGRVKQASPLVVESILASCQLDYQRLQDTKVAILAMRKLSKTTRDDRAVAGRIALTLLVSSARVDARADALQILGQLARENGKIDRAITTLQLARTLHVAQGNSPEIARDDAGLAAALFRHSRFADALRSLDDCLERHPDIELEGICHTYAVAVLSGAGYFEAADRENELARQLAASDEASADALYQSANRLQESGQHETAVVRFQQVLDMTQHSSRMDRTLTVELNLAYSLAELGRVEEAQAQLDSATVLDASDDHLRERTWVAAQIAYRRHDLGQASALCKKYFKLLQSDDDSVDRDDQIDVATLEARIALEQGDLDAAERAARSGVEQAESVRAAQSALELRPWVLAKRRAPYELLFTALARRGRTGEAALVFNTWQGRTVQDALARPRPPRSFDYRGIASQLDRLDGWLKVVTSATLARSSDPQRVLDTMRDIDLLALIVADGDLWTLTANHGPPQLTRIASLGKIQDLVDQFAVQPTRGELASALGALLLRGDTARKTRDVLHVIVDGQLGSFPVAALRRDDQPLIARRPVARVLRLPEARCVTTPRFGHATVLAASNDQLPGAENEAIQVAALLHTTPQIGSAATRPALLAAASDAVLHVAAHGEVVMDGASIVLADGAVSALEISARRVAPALVVLSACDAASSNDVELAGSLAAGFLGAGSQHVVATLSAISDAGAGGVMTRFYRAGGIADPVRALATVQAELSSSDNEDWPRFVVFGAGVCLESR